jgi:uncharacterized protein YjbI with pentapeptide repeats
MTQSEFDELVEKHRKYLSGEEGGKRLVLASEELIGADFRGKDLSRAELVSCAFCHVEAGGVSFRGAHLAGVDFRGAGMRGAVFDNAWLARVVFEGATLDNASFSGASVNECSFRSAVCRSAAFTDTRLHGADFREARLCHSVWDTVDVWGVDMREADIDYALFKLSCGALGWRIDSNIARQLAYHFCSMKCDDPEFVAAREALLPFANKARHVEECGVLALEERKEAEHDSV